jgi:hypothetical protein
MLKLYLEACLRSPVTVAQMIWISFRSLICDRADCWVCVSAAKGVSWPNKQGKRCNVFYSFK